MEAMDETLNTVDAGALREEVRRFRAEIERRLPEHTQGRRQVQLEPEAATYVQLFWEELGYSQALGVVSPEAESGQARIQEMLDWIVPESGKVSFEQLPKPSRLVEVVEEPPCAVVFTDESQGLADPPLYGVGEASYGIDLVMPSYLRWIAGELWNRAKGGWHQHVFQLSRPAGGEEPFPHLLPGCRRIQEGLWFEPSMGAGQQAYTAAWFRKLETLVDFMHGYPGEILRSFFWPTAPRDMGAVLRGEGFNAEAHAEVARLRRFSHPVSSGAQAFHRVGRLRGIPVWFYWEQEWTDPWLMVVVEPEQAPQVTEWLRTQGATQIRSL
jgi:hypothetical protein